MANKIILALSLFILIGGFTRASENNKYEEEYIYSMPIPEDFRVVAMAGGVHPKYALYKADIDSKGDVIYYEMPEEERRKGSFVEVRRFGLEEEALRSIFAAVRENDFFMLKDAYTAENILDGSLARLTVTENGRTHAVMTRNVSVERFDNIMMAINIALPDGSKVLYNEILRPVRR